MLQRHGNITKTVWHWPKNRRIDDWNRIEDPGLNSHSNSQLILNKGAKKHMMKQRQPL
jgi:hypothetical protein